MEEGADDGDILSQKTFSITYEDDAASVYSKMEETALNQIEEFLPKLRKELIKESDKIIHKSNNWRKRGMEDGEIDFRMSSYAIYNLVRAIDKTIYRCTFLL